MKAFFIILIAALFTSCVNTKRFGSVWVPNGQVFYQRVQDFDAHTDSVYKRVLTRGAKAILDANSDGSFTPSFIKFIEVDSINSISKVITGRKSTDDDDEIEDFFYPLLMDTDNKQLIKNKLYRSNFFKYRDIRPVVQAITIPFKFRFKVNDNFPSTASADFSVGLAGGYKFTNYRYRKYYVKKPTGKYAEYNDYTSQWVFSPGIFLAPTVVDLDSLHTNGKVSSDRSVVGLTGGAFFVAGYNNFNLGFALGIDKTFGSGPSAWIYSGKPWLGIILSVDIFK